jgi:hypothetical protein
MILTQIRRKNKKFLLNSPFGAWDKFQADYNNRHFEKPGTALFMYKSWYDVNPEGNSSFWNYLMQKWNNDLASLKHSYQSLAPYTDLNTLVPFISNPAGTSSLPEGETPPPEDPNYQNNNFLQPKAGIPMWMILAGLGVGAYFVMNK